MFYEISIEESAGRFGMYEANLNDFSDGWESIYDLEDECRNNVGEIYQLGKDELPEGIEDIRGRIANEPPHIYGYILAGQAHYFGIIEI